MVWALSINLSHYQAQGMKGIGSKRKEVITPSLNIKITQLKRVRHFIRIKNEPFECEERLNTLKIESILISIRMSCLVFRLVYNTNIWASFYKYNLFELYVSLFLFFQHGIHIDAPLLHPRIHWRRIWSKGIRWSSIRQM